MPRPSILSTFRDYSQPVLVNKGELYIEFYVRNPLKPTEQLRKRIRLNYLKGSMRSRVKEANRIKFLLYEKLKGGWNPILEKQNPKGFTRLSSAIDSFFKSKRELRPDTIRTYTSFLKIYAEYNFKVYANDIYVVLIDKSKAIQFLNFVYNENKVSPRTYNNYLLTLRIFFNWMKEQNYINDNPFESIKPKPKQHKQRMYINDAQRSIIKTHLQRNNLPFYYLVLFSYFTLLRRKEITFVRVKDIDLKRKLMFVSGDFSKNKQSHYVTIPDVLISIFTKMEIKKFDKNCFLFCEDLLPGRKKLSPKKISDLWLAMRKELKFPSTIQFMSLRDTGIRNLLKQGVSIDIVCKHARHSSIEITKAYLFHDEVVAHEKIINADQF